MNNEQRKTFFITITILAVMVLIPPWEFTYSRGKINLTKNGPYRLVITGRPEVPLTSTSTSELFGDKKLFEGYSRRLWNAEIDLERLLLQIGAVMLIGTGFFVYYKDKQ